MGSQSRFTHLSVAVTLFIVLCAGLFHAGTALSAGEMVGVIVKLEDAPLASYHGTVPGLTATSIASTGDFFLDVSAPSSQAYLSYLNKKMDLFEASVLRVIPSARMIHRYPVVLGGLSVILPKDDLGTLSRLPGVVRIFPDTFRQKDTERSPFFIRANTAWNKVGGTSKAGEGVIVGIIDTGIWPEHPSFSNPDPKGKAYGAPPAKWQGYCQLPNDDSPPLTCNNKLIGAREFLDTWKYYEPLPPGEFDSARDADGHGTHTASTAAGNGYVKASILGNAIGQIYGIAPRARVAMYKALGPGGGWDSDLVAAINQAVSDGVDVINYSIGPTGSYLVDPYENPDDFAFLDAYAAGVFVATSAGNSGPSENTVNHLGGWTTTVAASTTDRFFESTLTLSSSNRKTLTLKGASITNGISTATPVVLASDFGDEYCQSEFSAGSVTGKVVVCVRGINDRVAKSYNVKAGGAVGLIMYNPYLRGTAVDNHFIPTVHLEYDAGESLMNFINANPGISAKFTKGAKAKTLGDVVASFSSRGGINQTYGISKPDIAAPGVQILAGHTPEPIDMTGGNPGELFQAIEGTSMAAPHVAGAAAIIRQYRPSWTPGQIKSALMTTSKRTGIVKEDKTTAATPFDCGAGRVDLGTALNPGITFDVPASDYLTLKNELWNTNYPSIYVPFMGNTITLTRKARNVLTSTGRYSLKIIGPSDLRITVPSSLTISGGSEVPFTITIDATSVPEGEVRHATLIMKAMMVEAHIPITIVKVTP